MISLIFHNISLAKICILLTFYELYITKQQYLTITRLATH